jgi:hypothetical protein
MVSIQTQAASTMMDAFSQRFSHYLSTAGASLTGLARVHCQHFAPSLFSFVRGELQQLVPRRILNGFGQTVVS